MAFAKLRARSPRALATLLLCLLAPALAACGGSSSNVLIPRTEAKPLRQDFVAVAQAAKEGRGDCAETNDAIKRTEQDFLQVPRAVDAGLRERLTEGISNLSEEARARCSEEAEPKKQPEPQETATVETSPPEVETVQQETTPVETVEVEEVEPEVETEHKVTPPGEETGGVEPLEQEFEAEDEGEGEQGEETVVPATEEGGGIAPGGGVEPPKTE